MAAMLNSEQRAAFNVIMKALDEGANPRLFFIDGPGGSGKTYLYTTLISTLRGRSETARACASTGIDANLLPSGRTYSMFHLGINILDTTVSAITPRSKVAKSLRESKLVVWDESTMASSHALNSVDRLIRDINSSTPFPFGGKVFVLGGDFRQTLPIVPHGTRTAIVEACIKYSKTWKNFHTLKLIKNNRSVEREFSDWLLKLGEGTLTNDIGLDEELIEIPPSMLCKGDIVKEIFEDKLHVADIPNFVNKFILTPINKVCNELNEKILNLLDGECVTY
ncbi:ATP-dependent DNA helicase pif1-like [Polypterus senegalus]|uniref:ATP-dependent DNA helicase pif1-like n=1 Tax=Polypterus senegalus TaxID=55291 RepID=UPI0019659FD6|nr:ATP-dependent DNA helicase pif1-like [Polypterus senegalus]